MMTVPYLTGVALTKQNLESYRRALKESGYNPADFEVSCTSLVYLDEFRNTLDFGLAALEAGGSWLEIAVRAHG
ncbi:MAG: hypothetical protein HY314_01175, partial [Acidobacteria bacterium]|nr:hypothetical protein [Acidobacteriota bacterium]